MRARTLCVGVMVALLICVRLSPALREELLERLKEASDAVINSGLRHTSEFGRELTAERSAEQTAHRQRRLRDLR